VALFFQLRAGVWRGSSAHKESGRLPGRGGKGRDEDGPLLSFGRSLFFFLRFAHRDGAGAGIFRRGAAPWEGH